MAKRQIDVLINARDQASKKFGKIGQATAGLSKHFGGLKTAIAGALGTAALIRFGKDVMAAYGRQEAAVKKLSDALGTVGVVTKAAMADMQKWAASIQQQTTIGDEAVLEMAAMGAAMGKLTGEGLQKATVAAIGLSRRLSIDTIAAMRLVSRAALGDTGSLKRYGIVLDMTSTTQQKFNELLKIGADAFVLAQGETNTFTGRVEQLKNTVGDIKEQIGLALLPVLTRWMGIINVLANKIGELSAQEMQNLIEKIKLTGMVLIGIWTSAQLLSGMNAYKAGMLSITGIIAKYTWELMKAKLAMLEVEAGSMTMARALKAQQRARRAVEGATDIGAQIAAMQTWTALTERLADLSAQEQVSIKKSKPDLPWYKKGYTLIDRHYLDEYNRMRGMSESQLAVAQKGERFYAQGAERGYQRIEELQALQKTQEEARKNREANMQAKEYLENMSRDDVKLVRVTIRQ